MPTQSKLAVTAVRRAPRKRDGWAANAIVLGDYLAEWLDGQRGSVRPRTWENYRGSLNRYVPGKLRAQQLSEISPVALTYLYDKLVRRGGLDGRPLSPTTVRHLHGVLHKALEDAVRNKLIPTNPASRARVPRYDKSGQDGPKVHLWGLEQLAAFLEFADADDSGHLWRIIALTGMRRGELLGITWDNVDFDRRRLRVGVSLVVQPGGVMELQLGQRQLREIAVGDEAIAILRRVQAAQAARESSPAWGNQLGLVFTTDSGRPIHPSRVTRRFQKLVRESGQPSIRLQDLRNTHAAVLLEAGIPLHLVLQRLGIGDPWKAMQLFGHYVPPSDAAAAALFDELVRDPTQPQASPAVGFDSPTDMPGPS